MTSTLFRTELYNIKTIVVKTGSRILTAQGKEQRVKQLAEDLSFLHKKGLRVILVSSGAIAHGMDVLKVKKRPETIPLQQACASVGQIKLMDIYQSFFSTHDVNIGQVLLTWDDLRSKKRYLNLRNTLFQLLDCRIIPIVNENDSVGTEEIQFGNNDVLAAQISLLSHADVFVNLTDVGGLYDKNPQKHKDARHIPVISHLCSSVHKMASENISNISVGGMTTKLKAAEMLTRAGIPSLIGDGFSSSLLSVLKENNCSTLFLPSEKKMTSKHRWLAFTGQSHGKVTVDDGACKAIKEKGKSLLAAGILDFSGNFRIGDMVDITCLDKQVIARGMVNFPSTQIDSIKGCKTSEIKRKLGSVQFPEVIHRDNMVVL
ncbi:glutamate 5-kinase [Chitinispirillales bacterium ANBcel5]|uniref:glutamate 5-kinase n=1 Tax=Cellulosispirillum alkaliphilum TaxID=3039283 RepID=UPI002A573EAB|nr:glutamate 5-kinase [Chitinispirillales bacterium ANBcel5]